MKACVEDAKTQGAEGFIFLGDYISGLADPEKTMDLVYQICEDAPTVCIRGNRERYLLDHHYGKADFAPGSHTGSLLFTYQRLREKDLVFFSELPIAAEIQLGGIPVEIAHATTDNDRIYFEKGDQVIPTVFGQMRAPYLITGHSHKQYSCESNGKTIINPGSVGLPQGNGWHAQYALLEVQNGKIHSTFRQVAYDMEATIRAQFQSGLIEMGKTWAIADLYGAIEGKEHTKGILTQLYQQEDPQRALADESLWGKYANQMNLGFTEKEALSRFHKTK